MTADSFPRTGIFLKIDSAEPAMKRQLVKPLSVAFSAALRAASALTSIPLTESKLFAPEMANKPEPQ